MNTHNITAMFLLPMMVSGCGLMNLLGGEPNRDVYELRAPGDAQMQCSGRRSTELVIEEPKTRGTLDSDRIMIRPNALQVQYLPRSQWGDTVPVMLQTMLVMGFDNYDAFGRVGRVPLGGSGDYALLSEIVDFNAEVNDAGALVRLRVDAQMVDEMTASVVSQRRFRASAQATGTSEEELIPAFDQASKTLVAEMTDWGMRTLGVNPAACR